MDATERFAAAVAAPAGEMRLDVAAFCLAAHAHPGLDVDAQCARLDDLARRCPTPTFDGLRAYLFETLGFRGNDARLRRSRELVPRLGDRTAARHPDLARGRDDGGRAPHRRAGARRRHARSLPRDGRGARRRVVRPVPRRRALRPRGLPPALRARARQRARLLAARCSRRPIRTRSSARMLANLESGRLAADPIALGVAVRAAPDACPTCSADQRERIATTQRAVARALELTATTSARPADRHDGDVPARHGAVPVRAAAAARVRAALPADDAPRPRRRPRVRRRAHRARAARSAAATPASTSRPSRASCRPPSSPDGRYALATVGMRRVRGRRGGSPTIRIPRAEVVALDDPPADRGRRRRARPASSTRSPRVTELAASHRPPHRRAARARRRSGAGVVRGGRARADRSARRAAAARGARRAAPGSTCSPTLLDERVVDLRARFDSRRRDGRVTTRQRMGTLPA